MSKLYEAKRQKEAIYKLLIQMFGDEDVEKEKTWEWLKPPPQSELPVEYVPIVEGLSSYRGQNRFVSSCRKLNCDFAVSGKKIILEYDERQHFSEARRIALAAYPRERAFCFSVSLWEEYCAKIQAKDNDPVDRDEVRAYYDTVRDFEAARNGYKLFRIKDGEFDWEGEGALERLVNLFEGL